MGNNNLKKGVMKRVYFIWFSRKVAPGLFLYVPFLFVVALREAAREFFVVKIVDNFLYAVHSGGFSGGMNFVFSALYNTPVLPTMVILSSLGLSAFLLRRLSKNFKQVRLAREAV